MRKLTMICLMICSLAYSADVTYIKKELNDSTTIIKLRIPEDPDLYTCLDTRTYINTIDLIGHGKLATKELSLCNTNITHYIAIDSLKQEIINECTTGLDSLQNFNNELYTKLEQEQTTKWYIAAGAFLAGTLAGTLIGTISN